MAKQNIPQRKEQAAAQPQRARVSTAETPSKPLFNFSSNDELIFGKNNFTWMIIGAALILGGLMLMLGGEQPSPDVWDPNIIYSARIITLAPIVIIAGVIVEIYAIFKD